MRKFRAAIRRNGDLNFTPVSHYQTIAILDGSYQWIKDVEPGGASAVSPERPVISRIRIGLYRKAQNKRILRYVNFLLAFLNLGS